MPNRIRELREKRGLSVSGLARLVAVTERSVGYWESGRSEPRKAMARRLARALGAKVDDLGLTPASERRPAEPAAASKVPAAPADDRPRTVSAIVVHPDSGRVLMTERRRAEKYVLAWPGGLVEPGEEPEAAVRRELEEELALQGCEVERLLGTSETRNDMSPYWGKRFRHGVRAHNFLVTVTSAEVAVVDHEELSGARWLSVDQVREAVAELPSDVAEDASRFAETAIVEAARVRTAG